MTSKFVHEYGRPMPKSASSLWCKNASSVMRTWQGGTCGPRCQGPHLRFRQGCVRRECLPGSLQVFHLLHFHALV